MDGRFTVTLVDPRGRVLERDGTIYARDSGRPHFEARFAGLDAARAFCEGVVRELPHVECEVVHGGRVVLQHCDPDWRRGEEERVRQWFAGQKRRRRLVLAALISLAVLLAGGLVWWLR